MVKDTSTQFEFPKQSLLSRFLWPSKGRVCGELSKRQGQGWVAKLVGANSVSVVCVCMCVCGGVVHVSCLSVVNLETRVTWLKLTGDLCGVV